MVDRQLVGAKATKDFTTEAHEQLSEPPETIAVGGGKVSAAKKTAGEGNGAKDERRRASNKRGMCSVARGLLLCECAVEGSCRT